eukprot:552192-Amphidinium_carterae.1
MSAATMIAHIYTADAMPKRMESEPIDSSIEVLSRCTASKTGHTHLACSPLTSFCKQDTH